jgi:hypothetical protein
LLSDAVRAPTRPVGSPNKKTATKDKMKAVTSSEMAKDAAMLTALDR